MTRPPPQRSNPWQWPALLNLLAPAVACSWLAGLGLVHRLYIPPEYFALLAGAVWFIYTLDGLLDARRVPGSGDVTSRRARLHRALRLPLLLLLVLAAAGGAWLAWRHASRTLVVSAGVFSLPIVLYLAHAQALRRRNDPDSEGFLSQLRRLFPKEGVAGFMFAMGVMIPILDLQGRLPIADPQNAADALNNKGLLEVFGWLGATLISVFLRALAEDGMVLIGMLFATNCLFIALDEEPGEGANNHPDPGSARALMPSLARLAPVFAAALFASSAINFVLAERPGARPLMAMVGLAAALMLVVHRLRVRRRVSPAAAPTLHDLALVAPVLLVLAVGRIG